MTVNELRVLLNSFPGDMPVQLLDTTTDDDDASGYDITPDTLHVMPGETEDGETVDVLWIHFANRLNEQPV